MELRNFGSSTSAAQLTIFYANNLYVSTYKIYALARRSDMCKYTCVNTHTYAKLAG